MNNFLPCQLEISASMEAMTDAAAGGGHQIFVDALCKDNVNLAQYITFSTDSIGDPSSDTPRSTNQPDDRP